MGCNFEIFAVLTFMFVGQSPVLLFHSVHFGTCSSLRWKFFLRNPFSRLDQGYFFPEHRSRDLIICLSYFDYYPNLLKLRCAFCPIKYARKIFRMLCTILSGSYFKKSDSTWQYRLILAIYYSFFNNCS